MLPLVYRNDMLQRSLARTANSNGQDIPGLQKLSWFYGFVLVLKGLHSFAIEKLFCENYSFKFTKRSIY